MIFLLLSLFISFERSSLAQARWSETPGSESSDRGCGGGGAKLR